MTYIVYNTDTREVSSYHVEEGSALNNCPTGCAVASITVNDILTQPPSLFVDGSLVDDAARITEELENITRFTRDNLLKDVDAVTSNPLRWADLTAAKQSEWTQYRTDLLNITDQAGFPHSVTWPSKPA